MKHRTLSQLAFHGDGSALHDEHFACDGEAQTRTGKVAGIVSFHLVKPFKDPRQFILRHADPRIGHIDLHYHFAVAHLPAFCRHDDTTFIRELNGVISEVEQDL